MTSSGVRRKKTKNRRREEENEGLGFDSDMEEQLDASNSVHIPTVTTTAMDSNTEDNMEDEVEEVPIGSNRNVLNVDDLLAQLDLAEEKEEKEKKEKKKKERKDKKEKEKF